MPSNPRRSTPDNPLRFPRQFEVVIPTREAILEALTREAVPVAEQHLAELLQIDARQAEGFGRRIAAMARDGQILQNRKGAILIADRADLIAGRIEARTDGSGVVVIEAGEPISIAPREMNQVLHGDRVMVRPLGFDRRGRREGVIVEILERAQHRIVGRLHREHGVWFVVAADRRISQDILVEPDSLGSLRSADGRAISAAAGQVVTAELISQPTRHAQPISRVVEVLGDWADPGMEIEIALRKHNLPFEFSREVEREVARLPEALRKGDLAGRKDLRDLAFVTIDGETARDFDDAVYAEKDGRGFRLYVAIADVSHYVRDGTQLDQEARERSTSVYFPRRVIPMLPEVLSNGLCSLNADVDRVAMVCEMAVSRTGKVGDYKFYAAVFRSQARLTYTAVAEALYTKPPKANAVPVNLIAPLQVLDQVFHGLLGARASRGAIDFESVETVLDFDESGKIHSIGTSVRNDAHRLIEECMLAANVCAADFLAKNEHPALYRVHEGPTPEKLEALREFLKSMGLRLEGGEAPTAQDYARLLASVKGRPDASLLQTVMLRSLQQAVYAPDNKGHFGLAYPAYAHFTSPIRRYPDLLVHRAVKAILAGERYKPARYGERGSSWKELGEQTSRAERRADDASRDVVQWLKCYYMRDRIGESFSGVISAVTGFGVFVTLDEMFVEGLVHISDLGTDYFHLDAVRHELKGDRTGRVFRLAGRVQVNVVRVDLDMARIDFALDESVPMERKRKK